MRLVLVGALITLFDSQQPVAPAPPQTFRSGAQIVEVDVRVLGKDGRFVTDLGVPDFAITEDGVPQKIQSVVLVGIGAAPAAPSAGPPSAPSAGSAPLAQRPAQTWLFVFDTGHLTAGPLQRAREAVVTFVGEKFRDRDLGGVVVDGRMANNRLTSDREELKKAAAGVRMPGELRSRQLDMREWPRLRDEGEAFRIVRNERDAIQSAVARACAEEPEQCGRVPADLQVMSKARQMVTAYRTATLQTLTLVDVLSKGLASLPGPKTIVFFSEGFVLEDLESQLRQAIGQAARAGAHFYTVDARGLNRGGAGSQIIDAPMPDNPMGAQPTFDAQADGINSLAVDTGGFAIRNENNFGRALAEIQQDAGIYYVVGYAPANEALDGKYRAISVKVARPDVKIRARRGYLALPPAALLRTTAAASPKSAVAGSESPAGDGGTKGGSMTLDLPHVPVLPGLLALPETLTVSLPGEPAALPGRSAAPEAALRARVDGGKMVMALGRAPDSAPAFARLRPPGSGEASSAVNTDAELGWAAYEKGDVETAARHLSAAASDPDARPWVVYALGLSQFALRRFPDAARSWERVRLEVPEFEPIYFSLADAYSLQHEEGTALKVLREAERQWPADAEVANAIGVIQVRRGALDAAVESFEHATTIAPQDGLGYFNLARTHQMRLLKSQRYDRQLQKWIGGDEDRRRAIANFEKYLALGGPYERQAREALSALGWR
jgi:VWFA-related protein